MTSIDDLTAWRSDFTEQIAQLEAERKPLLVEVADIERQVEVLEAKQRELEERCAEALPPYSDGLALPLWGRLQDARRDMQKEVGRIRGKPLALLRALNESIAGRRSAIAQIDRALSVDLSAEKSRTPEVVPRPKPPPAAASPFELAVKQPAAGAA